MCGFPFTRRCSPADIGPEPGESRLWGEPPLEGKKYPGTTLPLSISPDGWHEVSAELPADRLPGKDLTLIFYIDVNGGEAADWLLIDNLELYQ